ncbi:MAG: pyruvate carboxyltransferase [Oscillospiraceae bacterium]|nr:pyruvate carboxyltransferase [Oscillospiraceae bacterium]
MSNTPWHNEKWFTSPWNFADEVRDTLNIPSKLKLHDVSLRDGEQQAGLIFTKDQKVAVAERLKEAGIHRIEAGMPAVSPQDEAAIKEIVKRNEAPGSPEIFAFARCVKDDVKRAHDCGVKGIVIEIPASEHMVEYAYNWTMEKAIDLSIESTALAKELGLYTVFFPIDGTRAELNWFTNLISRVANEGHMDALAIVDTLGGLAPSTVPYLVKSIKSVIDKPLEAHFHDDFGMGSANTVMALVSGAEVAHTTISGIGERAGNAAYEDVAMTLLTMYGVDMGLKYDQLYDISRWLQEFSGLKVRQNQGIIGEDIFKVESGIVTGWFKNCFENAPLELSPYRASLVGRPDWQVMIGKFSGPPTVHVHCEKLGIPVGSPEEVQEVVRQIKAKAYEKNSLLTVEEFEKIARSVFGQ